MSKITTGERRAISLLAVLTLFFSATVTPASGLADNPADYLEYVAVGDGRCHILSEGGKLMVMQNNHPDKAISFRLIRFFANVRQQGRATGIAQPGGEAVKLGCTMVDGRPQTWKTERSHFVTD